MAFSVSLKFKRNRDKYLRPPPFNWISCQRKYLSMVEIAFHCLCESHCFIFYVKNILNFIHQVTSYSVSVRPFHHWNYVFLVQIDALYCRMIYILKQQWQSSLFSTQYVGLFNSNNHLSYIEPHFGFRLTNFFVTGWHRKMNSLTVLKIQNKWNWYNILLHLTRNDSEVIFWTASLIFIDLVNHSWQWKCEIYCFFL